MRFIEITEILPPIAVIGLSLYGYKKGFLSVMIKPLSLLIRLFLSLKLSPHLSEGLRRLTALVDPRAAVFDSLPLSDILFYAISFLLIYLLVGRVLNALISMIKPVFERGIVGGVNRLFGLILGFGISIFAILLYDHFFGFL